MVRFKRMNVCVRGLRRAACVVLIGAGLTSCAAPPAAPPRAAAQTPAAVEPAATVDSEAAQFAQQVEQRMAATIVPAPAPAQPAASADIQWVAPAAPVIAAPPPAAPQPVIAKAPAPVMPQPPISAEIEVPAKSSAVAPAASPTSPPAPAPADLNTAELVRELAAKLEHERTTGKTALRASLAAAALSLVEPGRELTEKDLLSLSTDERQLVLAYQRVFTRLGQSMDGKDAAADREAMRLAAEELHEQLATQQRLRIRRAVLCTKVSGYGMFTRFAASSFLAGREHPVIVYAELDNFRPQIGDDGLYTVRLTQEIVLYNEADGLAVWRVKPSDILDRSHNRRRDFFVVQIVQLPDTLSVGKYILSLSVTDQHGQSMDEAKIPIQIVADESLIRSAAAGQ